MKSKHVVFRFSDGALHCLRCGDAYQLRVPCIVDLWLAIVEAYEKIHAGCLESKNAAGNQSPTT